VCETDRPAAEHLGVEVEKQADCEPCEFEVGEELGSVNSLQLLHTLDLDDQLVLDDEIGAIGHVQRDAMVHERDGHLTLEREVSLL